MERTEVEGDAQLIRRETNESSSRSRERDKTQTFQRPRCGGRDFFSIGLSLSLRPLLPHRRSSTLLHKRRSRIDSLKRATVLSDFLPWQRRYLPIKISLTPSTKIILRLSFSLSLTLMRSRRVNCNRCQKRKAAPHSSLCGTSANARNWNVSLERIERNWIVIVFVKKLRPSFFFKESRRKIIKRRGILIPQLTNTFSDGDI